MSNQAMTGGALTLNNPEHVSVGDTSLLGNLASFSGGAITINDGNNVAMNNITCIGNRSPGDGGCLYIDSVTLTLNNSDINENIGQRMGAGIFASDSRIQVGYFGVINRYFLLYLLWGYSHLEKMNFLKVICKNKFKLIGNGKYNFMV